MGHQINLSSFVNYLKEEGYQVLNEYCMNSRLFFCVIPECMYPFNFEIKQSKSKIVAKLTIDYEEYHDIKNILRALHPQESLYESIQYIQNGIEIQRNSQGRFTVFDEETKTQHIELIVTLLVEREEDYCRALEDLVFKVSFAFSSKVFIDTMEAVKTAEEFWGENCFLNVEWTDYTLRPIRATLPIVYFDMILLCDNSLVIRVQEKSDNESFVDKFYNEINQLEYICPRLINDSCLELVISNYNLLSDNSKLRKIVRIVNVLLLENLLEQHVKNEKVK